MADRDLDKDSYGHPGRSVLDDGNGAGGVTLGSSGAPGVATLSRFDRLVDALIETYQADIARLQIDLVLARQERDEFRESGRRYVECLTVERDGAVSRAKLCLAARRGAQEALTDERRAHEDTQAALAAAREQVDTMAAAWAAIREAQSGHHDSTEATHEEPKCDAAAWCAGCMPSYEDRSGVVVHEEDCPVDTLDKRAGKLRTCECCGERASTTCTECVDEVEDKGKADLAALAHDVRRAEEEYERERAARKEAERQRDEARRLGAAEARSSARWQRQAVRAGRTITRFREALAAWDERPAPTEEPTP